MKFENLKIFYDETTLQHLGTIRDNKWDRILEFDSQTSTAMQ